MSIDEEVMNLNIIEENNLLKDYNIKVKMKIKGFYMFEVFSEMYYPTETIIYGIKNNRDDFIKKGRKILNERC